MKLTILYETTAKLVKVLLTLLFTSAVPAIEMFPSKDFG